MIVDPEAVGTLAKVDWEALGTVAAAFIGALAFLHSLFQARRSDRDRAASTAAIACRERESAAAARESDRMRFLLGEKETVAFEAEQIADAPDKRVPREGIHALLLAALFESSDRARLQVYRAIDSRKDHQEKLVVEALEKDLAAAKEYRAGLDLQSFSKRLSQLQAAVPWTIPDGSVSAGLKQQIEEVVSSRRRGRTERP